MKEMYYLHVFGRHYPVVKRYFEDLESLYDFLLRLPRQCNYRPIGGLDDELERSCIVLKIDSNALPEFETLFVSRS